MGPHNLLGCNVVVDIYGENNTTKPNVKSFKWVFTYSGSSQPSELQRCGWSLGSQLCTSQAPPFHPLARSPEVSFCHILLIGKIGWSHKNRLTFSNQADLGWYVTKINWRFMSQVGVNRWQNKLTNLCRAVGLPTCSSPDFIWLTHLCFKFSKEILSLHSDKYSPQSKQMLCIMGVVCFPFQIIIHSDNDSPQSTPHVLPILVRPVGCLGCCCTWTQPGDLDENCHIGYWE